MKLKYSFLIHEIDGQPIAVAVGDGFSQFNGMIQLNQTGKFIFEQLQACAGIADIAAGLAAKYDLSPEAALEDTRAFLAQLNESGLIEE